MIEEETETLLVAVSIATFGGLVNWLRQKGPRNLSRLIVVLCTAGFAGLIAYYAHKCNGLQLAVSVRVLRCCGLRGRDALRRGREQAEGINT